MYEPKHAFSRGQIVFNRRLSQIGSMDESMASRKEEEANLPAARLPLSFHRPRSKYKKSIYNNAVVIYVSDWGFKGWN